jgi:hypothetical protein
MVGSVHQRKPEEIVLAFRRRCRWNVRFSTTDGSMTRKKFLLPEFDACSVALFASLVFMGPQPGRAQQSVPSRPALSAPRDDDREASHRSTTAAAAPIPPNSWTPDAAREAFRRADKNGDGRLSPQEASIWPSFAAHFERYDTDKDGAISSAEFERALK